ncbi:unnamed protein product [Ectocarpus sp. CCAP 1310/34]|nr:unnamed protein product [Ectocarpus sp. CCAP 1310/34]
MARKKTGSVEEDEGAALEERRRVLFHASSLNRSDIIKKVVSAAASNNDTTVGAVAPGSSSSTSGDCDVEREVLDHVDENGLTALHHAVKKSSLDAIRVLLRLGVDVTAKGGAQSPYPNLTAYQVALSGGCKGNPEEIKQIFLTEAVQAIAEGDAERLGEFLDAGVVASSEYGADGSNEEGGSSTSLAKWAEQLGQSDMLTSLSASLANDNATIRRRDDGEAGNPNAEAFARGDTGETGLHGAEEAEAEGSRVWGDGGRGAAADDVRLFVGELRQAIVDLTAESEELEEELAHRGTLGIIKRARQARQDLILASSEVDTASALCDKWRAEEDAASQDNARLQAQVIEAQLAVQRHRAGLQGSDGDDSRSSPIARGKETPPPARARDRPEAQASKAFAAGEKERTTTNSSSSPRAPPSSENMTFADVDVRAGEEEGDTDLLRDGGVGNPGGIEDSRRTEEAEALGSQLQIIAMHLEDELRMMRSLIDGEGAVGVVRRIRALREEIEAAEEEARQTYAVSRYLQARVIVLHEVGNELFAQLDRLNGYLREPPGAALVANGEPPRAANKEDIDDDDVTLERGHYHRDPVPSGNEEENTLELRRNIDGGEDEGSEENMTQPHAPHDEDTLSPAEEMAAEGSAAGSTSPRQEGGGGGGGREEGEGECPVFVRPQELPEAGVFDSDAGEVQPPSPANPVGEGSSAATEESDSAGGSGREGRARALLNARGVDTRSRARSAKKVTVVQDVLSVLFGWDVSSDAERKAARGEPEELGLGGNSGGSGGMAGVMFA